MVNENLLSVNEGDKNWSFQISIRGYTPTSGGSGHVPEGRYELEILNASIVAKRNGSGKNIKLEMITKGPAAFAGVSIVAFHPAPIGAEGSKELKDGESFIKSLAFSMADAQGKAGTLTANDAPMLNISPTVLIGKRVFALLEDGQGEYANRSGIRAYIGKDEFEKFPGPANAGATATSAQQTKTPDLLGGGTNGAVAQPQGARTAAAAAMGL